MIRSLFSRSHRLRKLRRKDKYYILHQQRNIKKSRKKTIIIGEISGTYYKIGGPFRKTSGTYREISATY
jgi:hypothetical protein